MQFILVFEFFFFYLWIFIFELMCWCASKVQTCVVCVDLTWVALSKTLQDWGSIPPQVLEFYCIYLKFQPPSASCCQNCTQNFIYLLIHLHGCGNCRHFFKLNNHVASLFYLANKIITTISYHIFFFGCQNCCYKLCKLSIDPREKKIYLPKRPHMVKMYNQLPDLGQMAKICCILMRYKYEVYHGFDTTTLHNGTFLYNSLYHKIYFGQMKKICCIIMWYKYEVYHKFDTTTLHNNTILYTIVYTIIYTCTVGYRCTKCISN